MAATALLSPAPRPPATPAQPVRVRWLRWLGPLVIAGIRLAAAPTYGTLTWWQVGLLHGIISSCY